MITVAVSIDPDQLRAIDRLVRTGRRRASGKALSRSGVVRQALDDYLSRHARQEQEARDRDILSRHRECLAREATALVAEQAEP